MNTKAKGSRLERALKNKLKERGFLAIRSSASLFPDVIAIRPDIDKCLIKDFCCGICSRCNFRKKVYIFECKYDGYLSKEEKAKLKHIADAYDALCFVAFMLNRKMKVMPLE